ncbi:MAG: T9SS type A sorting domain-containing protein [Bacteroidia bacterium]|nr:T9SS type A sorting domain-containing protein [Bacteroidia bacterium]
MIARFTVFFSLLFFSLNPCIGQATPFTQIWGDPFVTEQATAVVQLPSGSIFITGAADTDSIGGFDIVLSKLSPNGNLLWQKYYGTPHQDYANGLLLYDEDHLVVSGNRTEMVSGSFRKIAFLMAIDTTGKEMWTRDYPDSTGNTHFKTVEKTPDGGLIACGSVSAANGNGNDSYILKTDATGNPQWQGEYQDTLGDVAQAARNVPGGGYIVVGDQHQQHGHYNMYITRLDSLGKSIWAKTITQENNGGAQNVIVTASGNYLITGESYPDISEFYFDIYLVMVSPNGQIIKESFIGESFAEAGYRVYESPHNIFTVCGYGYNFANLSTDMIVVRTDSNLHETNRRYYGTNDLDQGFDIVPSVYGGFLAAGFSSAGNDNQFMLVYDPFPEENTDGLEIEGQEKWAIYPNPVKSGEYFYRSPSFLPTKFTIYRLTGQKIAELHWDAGQDRAKMPSHLTPGVYLYHLEDGRNKTIGKIIVQ